MKIMSVLLILLGSIGLTSCSHTNSQIPNEFIETNLRHLKDDEGYQLNKFGVKFTDGKLEVNKVGELHKCEYQFSDGKLLGIDRGEWGGQLCFIPTDTAKKTLKIKEGNIKFIFSFKNKLYFIEGLAHSTTNTGSLYKLYSSINSFVFKKIMDFDGAPEAFAVYQNKLLIATHINFYSIENFKQVVIYKNIFRNGLYPNSIAIIDDKNIFFGMQGAIAKLDLWEKNLKFYKNKG
ncbi:hypothetical protein Pedsa_1413 [Pseudopedobacter saltans DSM 12145]|uniref:Lipoprotein n=1 Tax=Pseudopedobacter saltans (strain ATCC 51119 / DSM 12145 / JCM 21818 / CCUG 39354 / LMG 10337 / NBRC 100064 / NCIMB 13643) TaxID=762903 RepID=F0S4I8_PSESL|nr:hypothetical protein [Pseudopedobacter saltans]ADY51979.1 hypothetical protein Pedsa_1413 [Pseudopedobacter saltans DSM 12145]